jgi:hypothetical protein
MRMTRIAIAAVGAFACLGGVAQADDYCVGSTGCVHDEPSLSSALNDANINPGRDTILVKGIHAENANDIAGNPVDIIGVSGPVLKDAGTNQYGLQINEPSSTVSNLTIDVPVDTSYYGLYLLGTADNVTVTAAPGTGYFNRNGVYLSGGTFANGTVTMPVTREDQAILQLNGATSILRDSTVTAGVGVGTGGPGSTRVERTTISAERGIVATAGTLDVTDTLIRTQRLPGNVEPPGGLEVRDSTSGIGPTAHARHLTVIGSDAAQTVGVRVHSEGTTQPAELTLSDSIVRGYPLSLQRTASAGTANLTVDYTDFQTSDNANTGSGAGSLALGLHNLDVDPLFADAAGGDFRLTKCSPLVDHGSPDALASGESTTDRGGSSRVVDGDGNGSAIGDVGAFEYQPPPVCPPPGPGPGPGPGPAVPPVLSALKVAPTKFRAAGSGPSAVAAARTPVGALVSYRLSIPALVKFTVKRPTTGRRAANGKCAKAKRSNRKRRHCTRYVGVKGSFTRQSPAGPDRFRFSGRVGGKKLRPGRYRLYAKPGSGLRVFSGFRIAAR